ncbi:VirB8/TrbF family protein, partial [Klebsiella grimontii]
CGAALTASAALMLAMPLKKVVPYVVNVNTTTGEVTAPRQQMSEHFEPAWANESFFVRRWIEDMLTINQHTTVNINA